MSCASGLTTVEVMRVTKVRFIQFSSRRQADDCMVNGVLGSAPFGLSDQETKDVELAHLLLAHAEKVAKKHYGCAKKLHNLCDFLSSSSGNFVQIRCSLNACRGGNVGFESCSNVMLLDVPFYQVTEFVVIQVIVESVASSKKIHFIDLAIRNVGHCIMLKVIAVGVTSKKKIEDTGRRLAQFAEALKLPFTFKIAMVKDIKDVKEDIFELETGEVVAVYCPLLLSSTMSQPNCSESLMKVLRNLNPRLMVVIEIEANHNSAIFINRSMRQMELEETYMSHEIKNIVASEGEERVIRHMKIEGWRSLFTKCRMFACGMSCTLGTNGKCLVVGWKETPILSLSVWKFHAVNAKTSKHLVLEL
ncbi:unnamed protein product [Malus baccata var. baccata]